MTTLCIRKNFAKQNMHLVHKSKCCSAVSLGALHQAPPAAAGPHHLLVITKAPLCPLHKKFDFVLPVL